MKTTLLASTALVLSVGAAAAADFTMVDTGHEHTITLSGDARMGIIHHDVGEVYETKFTSRARVEFTGAGETDGGLGFGFSFRADNAGGAADGNAGSVFISQGGHTLAMGDVDSAAKAAVGDVSGVGLTGLGDYNEATGGGNTGLPAALYSYTGGALSLYVGVDGADGLFHDDLGDAYSLGAAYDGGTFSLSFGYENWGDFLGDVWAIGAEVELGAVVLKAVYGDADIFFGDVAQSSMSVDIATGATTFTAFVTQIEDTGSSDSAVGLGVSHDLGGGASIVAGVVDSDFEGEVIWDAGISMDF
jgi:outer membrane protein OmpU